MANLAYQVTNGSYQGNGQFAYQGSSGSVVTPSVGGGGSGAHYRTHTDWDVQRAKRRKRIEAKVETIENRIDAQKKRIERSKEDYDQRELDALSRKLRALQTALLALLAELDMINKAVDDAEMQDVAAIAEILMRFH